MYHVSPRCIHIDIPVKSSSNSLPPLRAAADGGIMDGIGMDEDDDDDGGVNMVPPPPPVDCWDNWDNGADNDGDSIFASL